MNNTNLYPPPKDNRLWLYFIATSIVMDMLFPDSAFCNEICSIIPIILASEWFCLWLICTCPETGFNDKITGYVSRGRGIIIHRADCKNLEKIPGIENRIIEVDWDRGDSNEITPIYLKTGIKEDANQIIRNTVEKFKGEIISGSLSDTGTKEMDGIIIVKPRISGAVKNIVAALNKLEFVKTVKLKKK